MTAAVYTASELAELTGVSEWSIYRHRDEFPVAAIPVGRRLVWPKAPVDRLLGIDPVKDESGPEGPPVTLSPVVATTSKDSHGY